MPSLLPVWLGKSNNGGTMSEILIWMAALLGCGFILSRSLLHFLEINDLEQGYRLKKDPWFYILGTTALGFTALYFFLPAFPDFVFPFHFLSLMVWLVCSFLIYVAYLFENNHLTALCLVVSAAVVSLILPADSVIFSEQIPLWADRIFVVLSVCAFSYGMSLLYAMDGILAMTAGCAYFGIAAVAFMGGIPLMLGMFAAFAAGVWGGYFQLNKFPAKIFINQGASLSAGFLLSCLLLQGAAEFAGASMLTIVMFVWAELVYAVFNRYILNQNDREMSENTAHWQLFANGVNVEMITFGVFKILCINVVLALFQLYAANPFSLPIFVFVVDLWLLSIMNRVSLGDYSFAHAHKEFIKNIKEGWSAIKKQNNKDGE